MENKNITIQEEYSLPSKGQIYSTTFDPTVKLRSMTVAEEMKRLTSTNNPYKLMSEIIEDCLESKKSIPVYDMCLGDYQYLLHKLRVVTYGPEYKISVLCPNCGKIFEDVINLDDLEVFEYTPEVDNLRTFTLPITKSVIEIGFQTPRDLDTIARKKEELKKQAPDMEYDPTMMLTLESLIKSVDGETIAPFLLRDFIKKLPLKDSTVILQRANKLNSMVGVDINIQAECPDCKNNVHSTFRFTNEFFRPEVDE